MIVRLSERFYNSTNKMFYEIRVQYLSNGFKSYEIYYKYQSDRDWNYEITLNSHLKAIRYIKQKGV